MASVYLCTKLITFTHIHKLFFSIFLLVLNKVQEIIESLSLPSHLSWYFPYFTPLRSVFDILISNIVFPFVLQHYILPSCLWSTSVSDRRGRVVVPNFQGSQVASFLRDHTITAYSPAPCLDDVPYTEASTHVFVADFIESVHATHPPQHLHFRNLNGMHVPFGCRPCFVAIHKNRPRPEQEIIE